MSNYYVFYFSKSVPLLHAIFMFSKIKVTYSPNVQDFKFFPDTNYSDYFFLPCSSYCKTYLW